MNSMMMFDFDYWILLVLNDAARQVKKLHFEITQDPLLYDRIFEANGLRSPPNLVSFVSKPDKFLDLFGRKNLEDRYKPIYTNVTKNFREIGLLNRPIILQSGVVTLDTDVLDQQIIDEDLDDFNQIFSDVRGLLCKGMIEMALKDHPHRDALCKEYHSIAHEKGIY